MAVTKKKVTRKKAAAKKAEPILSTDEDGNEFEQRPIDLNKVAKVEQVEGARVKCISLAGSKLFLSDGFIMPHEVQDVLVSDYDAITEGLLQKVAG